MREHGKREQRPNAEEMKKKAKKSLLLQTYLTSLLCLVGCVAMFFGTTYAWFTSEVTSANNEIYIGVLDTDLEKQQADGSWVSLREQANSARQVTFFDKTVFWEPGYTELETVKVSNKGDLAFNYTLNFTDGKVTDKTDTLLQDDAWKSVAALFDVWVFDHSANGAAPAANSYEDIAAANSGWTPVGSLAEVLSGKTVLNGTMTAEENAAETAAVYTVALHMKDAATASVMGHKISLSVKLTAYQLGHEQDSFGNTYDQNVVTADELNTAFAKGGTVVLAADIDLAGTQVTVPAGVKAVLDLNEHTISDRTDKPATLVVNNGELTVRGEGGIRVEFDGAVDNSGAVNAIANRGTLIINGGTIGNTGVGNQIGYGVDNYNGAVLIVNGGTITASGSSAYDGIRLFCGGTETVVTVNGGEISSIWAQNPTTNKAEEVKGTVVVNGGSVTTVYYENYTTVKVAPAASAAVVPYGAGSDNTEMTTEDGYSVYRFCHN